MQNGSLMQATFFMSIQQHFLVVSQGRKFISWQISDWMFGLVCNVEFSSWKTPSSHGFFECAHLFVDKMGLFFKNAKTYLMGIQWTFTAELWLQVICKKCFMVKFPRLPSLCMFEPVCTEYTYEIPQMHCYKIDLKPWLGWLADQARPADLARTVRVAKIYAFNLATQKQPYKLTIKTKKPTKKFPTNCTQVLGSRFREGEGWLV